VSLTNPEQRADLVALITDEARRVGVDPALAVAVAERESGLNPDAPLRRGNPG